MLTDREIMMIKRYAILPKVGMAALITAFALCGLWLILVMVDDLACNAQDFYSAGLYIFLAFVIILVALFCYSTIASRVAQRSKKWTALAERLHADQQHANRTAQAGAAVATMAAGSLARDFGGETMQKVGTGLEVVAGVEATVLAAQFSAEAYSNAKAVADMAGIALPKAKKYVLLTVLAPIIILIGAYIPEYVHSNEVANEAQSIAAAALEGIEDSLDSTCALIYCDDPFERYQDYGYSISGYSDESMDESVRIDIDENGAIDQITYRFNIDMDATPESNLEQCKEAFTAFEGALAGTSTSFANEDMKDIEIISGEFEDAFVKGTYYDDIELSADFDSGMRIYWSFDTDSEEEFDEYTNPHIYVMVYAQM